MKDWVVVVQDGSGDDLAIFGPFEKDEAQGWISLRKKAVKDQGWGDMYFDLRQLNVPDVWNDPLDIPY